MKYNVPTIGNKVVILTPIYGKRGIATVVKVCPDCLYIKADWIPSDNVRVKYTDVRRATAKDLS